MKGIYEAVSFLDSNDNFCNSLALGTVTFSSLVFLMGAVIFSRPCFYSDGSQFDF